MAFLLILPKRSWQPKNAGPNGTAPGLVRKQEKQEKDQARAFIRVSLGNTKHDIINGLGLASLSDSDRLWCIGVVPNGLVTDPWLVLR